jgi:hypothetical protein
LKRRKKERKRILIFQSPFLKVVYPTLFVGLLSLFSCVISRALRALAAI